jgi:hypothetical protein
MLELSRELQEQRRRYAHVLGDAQRVTALLAARFPNADLLPHCTELVRSTEKAIEALDHAITLAARNPGALKHGYAESCGGIVGPTIR